MKSIESEGLYTGDIIIWQPSSYKDVVVDQVDEDKVMFSVPTVKDFAINIASQADVRVFVIRVDLLALDARRVDDSKKPLIALPWLLDGIDANGDYNQMSGGDRMETRDLMMVEELYEAVDDRTPISAFANKLLRESAGIAETYGTTGTVAIEDKDLWLFDKGSPLVVPDGPFYTSLRGWAGPTQEDRKAEATLADVADRGHGPLMFYAVPFHKPAAGCGFVALHFFDKHVREVGGCIVEVEIEDTDVDIEERTPGTRQPIGIRPSAKTGRPAVNADVIFNKVNEWLGKPTNDAFRDLFALGACNKAGHSVPPLRILVIQSGRIRAKIRETDPDVNARKRIISEYGDNRLLAALRVEIDDEVAEDTKAQNDDVDVDMAKGAVDPLAQADGDDRANAKELSREEGVSDAARKTTSGAFEAVQNTSLSGRGLTPDEPGLLQVEVFHTVKTVTCVGFGHPFLISIPREGTCKDLVNRIHEKLLVPLAQLRSWHIDLFIDQEKVTNDDYTLLYSSDDGDDEEFTIRIGWEDRTHHGMSPLDNRTFRENKPLTIRGR